MEEAVSPHKGTSTANSKHSIESQTLPGHIAQVIGIIVKEEPIFS